MPKTPAVLLREAMGALALGCFKSQPGATLDTIMVLAPRAVLCSSPGHQLEGTGVICAHLLLLGLGNGFLTSTQYLNPFFLLPVLESVKDLFLHSTPLEAAEPR